MPPAELENLRSRIIEKNKKIDPKLWDLDDLHIMAAVVGVLRRRVSGPPKAKTAKPKKEVASLDDLA